MYSIPLYIQGGGLIDLEYRGLAILRAHGPVEIYL
jgi:hypothetical protein